MNDNDYWRCPKCGKSISSSVPILKCWDCGFRIFK